MYTSTNIYKGSQGQGTRAREGTNGPRAKEPGPRDKGKGTKGQRTRAKRPGPRDQGQWTNGQWTKGPRDQGTRAKDQGHRAAISTKASYRWNRRLLESIRRHLSTSGTFGRGMYLHCCGRSRTNQLVWTKSNYLPSITRHCRVLRIHMCDIVLIRPRQLS